MEFNICKWNVISIGRENYHNVYTLHAVPLKKSDREKDLGVVGS